MQVLNLGWRCKILEELYEQMEFVLSGGALKLLVDFLRLKVKAALIVTPRDTDLEIIDALGVQTEGLFLRGQATRLLSAFPEQVLSGKFAVDQAAVEGEWPWAVRIHGVHWSFYILLRQSPETLLPQLHSFAGLISWWQAFQHFEKTEERLSRLSYMILATKNTLASIFEPMPLDYYAAFLTDVLRESLFPRSLTVFQDDGKKLTFLEGDERPVPQREGLYSQTMLPPAPVVITKGYDSCEVVLPIIEPHRLFCVSEWDKLPTEETLNFLELVGNLASRSLSINNLKTQNSTERNAISSNDYTILSLRKAMNALQDQKDLPGFLSLAADIFTELVPKSECFLVIWNKERQGYLAMEYRKKGIRSPFDPIFLPSSGLSSSLPSSPVPGEERAFFDTRTADFSAVLNCPWPEMARMRYVFPFWDEGRLGGFAALGSEDAIFDGGDTKLAALQILARFVAFDLRKFIV
jgi:hypothetical protein